MIGQMISLQDRLVMGDPVSEQVRLLHYVVDVSAMVQGLTYGSQASCVIDPSITCFGRSIRPREAISVTRGYTARDRGRQPSCLRGWTGSIFVGEFWT